MRTETAFQKIGLGADSKNVDCRLSAELTAPVDPKLPHPTAPPCRLKIDFTCFAYVSNLVGNILDLCRVQQRHAGSLTHWGKKKPEKKPTICGAVRGYSSKMQCEAAIQSEAGSKWSRGL